MRVDPREYFRRVTSLNVLRITSLPRLRRLSTRQKVFGLAVLSLAGNELTALRLVALIAHYGLLFYTAYFLAEMLISSLLSDIGPQRNLGAILAGVSVCFALLWTAPTLLPPLIFLLAAVGILAIDFYLLQTIGTAGGYPTELSYKLFHEFKLNNSTDIADHISRRNELVATADSPLVERSINFTERLSVGILLILPFLAYGLVLPVFDVFYPILELGLLLGVVAGPSIARRTQGFEKGEDVLEALDAPGQLAKTVSNSELFGFKGILSIGFIGLNATLPATMFFLFITILPGFVTDIASNIAEPTLDLLLASLVYASIEGALLFFSLYGLWFWRTELQRLPTFVRYWESTHLEGQHFDVELQPLSLKTRPMRGMFVPSFLLLSAVLVAMTVLWIGRGPLLWGITLLYVVSLGVGIAYFIEVARTTIHSEAQSIKNESRVLTSNCLIQFGSIAGASGLSLSYLDMSIAVFAVSGLGFMALGILFLFYYPDGRQWLRQELEVEPHHEGMMYAIGFAILIVLSWFYFPYPSPESAALSKAVILVVGGGGILLMGMAMWMHKLEQAMERTAK